MVVFKDLATSLLSALRNKRATTGVKEQSGQGNNMFFKVADLYKSTIQKLFEI
jgi:hypothetical protein